mgnify:CR=1 FL=1
MKWMLSLVLALVVAAPTTMAQEGNREAEMRRAQKEIERAMREVERAMKDLEKLESRLERSARGKSKAKSKSKAKKKNKAKAGKKAQELRRIILDGTSPKAGQLLIEGQKKGDGGVFFFDPKDAEGQQRLRARITTPGDAEGQLFVIEEELEDLGRQLKRLPGKKGQKSAKNEKRLRLEVDGDGEVDIESILKQALGGMLEGGDIDFRQICHMAGLLNGAWI